MSELVQQHMESMTEEIGEMRRTKLFSVDETKIILKTCRHFENKINGPAKDLQDFKDYIQFEKNVLRDIKLRRNKMKISANKNKIEFKILKRIKYLYEIALQRFTNDFTLCLAYFKFCHESNYHQAASLAIQNMLKTFSHTPQSFQVASAWYLKKDVKQALSTIIKGLAIHKDCQELYSEAIQLELLNREKDEWADDSRTQKANDATFCKKIETFVQEIFTNIKDCNFLLKILRILEKHSITKGVQDMVIDWLLTNFPNEELVWYNLAERELNGYHSGNVEEITTNSTEFCLNRCMKRFEEGLEKIYTAKKTALWTLYLDFLLDLEQQSRYSKVITSETLASKIQEASKQIELSEKYYIEWAKRTKDEEEVTNVIESGLRAVADSVELWKLRLKCEVMKDNVDQFDKVFKRAILSLKRNSVEMWLMAIRYHSLVSTNEVIERIYMDAVRQTKEVSNIMKPEFIQWLALSKGIKEARQSYHFYAQKEPYCKALHTTMAKIESIEIDMNIDEMESIYKLASDQFGLEDSEVWINLLELYLKYQDKFDSKNTAQYVSDKITQTNAAAEAALANNPILLVDYKEKYHQLLKLYSHQ